MRSKCSLLLAPPTELFLTNSVLFLFKGAREQSVDEATDVSSVRRDPRAFSRCPVMLTNMVPNFLRESCFHAPERPRPTGIVLARNRVAHLVLPELLVTLVDGGNRLIECSSQFPGGVGGGADQIFVQVPVHIEQEPSDVESFWDAALPTMNFVDAPVRGRGSFQLWLCRRRWLVYVTV